MYRLQLEAIIDPIAIDFIGDENKHFRVYKMRVNEKKNIKKNI